MKTYKLNFIVNGQEILIEATGEVWLITAAEKAVKKSHYDSHRHISEFQIEMAGGTDSATAPLRAYTKRALSKPIFIVLKAGIGA